MLIELTEQQINNLIVFLNRVEIKGFQEVEAFNQIVNILFKTESGMPQEGEIGELG